MVLSYLLIGRLMFIQFRLHLVRKRFFLLFYYWATIIGRVLGLSLSFSSYRDSLGRRVNVEDVDWGKGDAGIA